MTTSNTAAKTEYEVPGLQTAVEIIVERGGVPHVYANSSNDAFLAQGCHAAREGLCQLEMFRRREQGWMRPLTASARGPCSSSLLRCAWAVSPGRPGTPPTRSRSVSRSDGGKRRERPLPTGSDYPLMRSSLVTLPLSPDELLTTTRAVRRRLDLSRPVPLELVRECLEVALQAPSGSNRQSWHWVVVTDQDLRAAIGEIYSQEFNRYARSTNFAGNLFADQPGRADTQERVGASALDLGANMGNVPVLVLPCIRTDGPLSAGSQAGLWGSLLPAAWSYCLAARARGLGTAWTSLHLAQEAEVAAILGIPEDVRQGALIPTAFYTGETFRPAQRDPLDSVLHVDAW